MSHPTLNEQGIAKRSNFSPRTLKAGWMLSVRAITYGFQGRDSLLSANINFVYIDLVFQSYLLRKS